MQREIESCRHFFLLSTFVGWYIVRARGDLCFSTKKKEKGRREKKRKMDGGKKKPKKKTRTTIPKDRAADIRISEAQAISLSYQVDDDSFRPFIPFGMNEWHQPWQAWVFSSTSSVPN